MCKRKRENVQETLANICRPHSDITNKMFIRGVEVGLYMQGCSSRVLVEWSGVKAYYWSSQSQQNISKPEKLQR